jgi:hypothetical protein
MMYSPIKYNPEFIVCGLSHEVMLSHQHAMSLIHIILDCIFSGPGTRSRPAVENKRAAESE